MKKQFLFLLMSGMLFSASSIAQVNFNNQLIVYFKSGVQRVAPSNTTASITPGNVLNVLNSYGIPSSNVIPSFPTFNEADTVNVKIGETSRQMNRAKIFTITITNAGTKQNLLNSLNALSEVLYAETNGKLTTNLIPADGRFNQQWGLRNTFVPGADIHAVPAWDIFTGNPNAIIAVMDRGVDRDHNDLNTKILGGDVGFTITTDPTTGIQSSHGSHVAGIAAAITNNNNNNGVAGVDWHARIHPKNIFDGTGDPDATQSIIDAVNFNANVWTLNNSWRISYDDGTPGRYSVTVRSAFAHAYRNNRVSCVAMGNHQFTNPNVVGFPAGFNTGLIAVGATNINDQVTIISAQGPHIDVSAPGVGIWSTNFNNGYIDLTGTSTATPYVAGLASLLKGFNTNLANDDIEQIIKLTADDANANTLPGFDIQMGTGRINALRALQSLQAPNTLQQLSTTGGTVFSTSGNMTRVFLGVPGLSDGTYIVKRIEVRKTISLPVMCSLVGVWGRGVGTTGYREELDRCFGEGICEIVPGTLTNTGATLRTWIYQVWNIYGQYLGSYPTTANNAVFQYTVLGVPRPATINGDNSVCTTSNNYSIPNLPLGATVQWQATPAGIVTINSPNSPQTTLTRNSNGIITLTAVISNACGGPITISKQNIIVGAPLPPTITNLNYDAQCGTFMEVYSSNPASATGYIWNLNFGQVVQDDASAYFYVAPLINNPIAGQSYYNYLSVQAKNVCGTSDPSETRQFTVGPVPSSCSGGGGGPILLRVSPNPTISSLTVETIDNSEFTKLRIVDKMGHLKKQFNYSPSKKVTLNVSDLPADVYRIQALINNNWTTVSFIKQ